MQVKARKEMRLSVNVLKMKVKGLVTVKVLLVKVMVRCLWSRWRRPFSLLSLQPHSQEQGLQRVFGLLGLRGWVFSLRPCTRQALFWTLFLKHGLCLS